MLFTRRPNWSCGLEKNSTRVFRASALSGSDTASSRSRITLSAPEAAALAKRSGRLPGVKSRVRQVPSSRIAGLGVGRIGGAAFVDQELTAVGEHQLAALVVGARVDGEDAFARPRL